MGKQASSALGQRAKASVLGGTRREFLKEITLNTHWKDIPGGSAEKNPPAAQEAQKLRVGPLGREDPLEEAWQPSPVFLPGEPHGQGNLVDFCPWVRRVRHA